MNYGMDAIAELFSTFHDGLLVEGTIESDKLSLKVDIRYLAAIVHPKYTSFYVTLFDCKALVFKPWKAAGTVYTDPVQLFAQPLNILEARVNRHQLEISCSLTDNHSLPYRGGEIVLHCNEMQVYDEQFNRLQVADVKVLSQKYWKNFSQKP